MSSNRKRNLDDITNTLGWASSKTFQTEVVFGSPDSLAMSSDFLEQFNGALVRRADNAPAPVGSKQHLISGPDKATITLEGSVVEIVEQILAIMSGMKGPDIIASFDLIERFEQPIKIIVQRLQSSTELRILYGEWRETFQEAKEEGKINL